MRVDGRLGYLVSVLGYDHRRGLVAEPILETFEIVLSVIVVLVEDGDPGVRLFLQDILRVDPCLALIVGLPAHGPREVLRIIPFGRTGRDEQLRHLLGVHVLLDGSVGWRAERVEDQEHLIALDQLARLLDRFRRTVGVVIGDEVDLAAIDSAFGIDFAEVGRFGPADYPLRRRRPAVRHDVADLYLGIGCAGIVFLLRSALPPLAASKMMAVENAANRRATKDISFLPTEINECVCLLSETSFGSLHAILNTLHHVLSMSTNGTRCALSAPVRAIRQPN